MNRYSFLQQMIGLALIGGLLVGCGAPQAISKPVPPTSAPTSVPTTPLSISPTLIPTPAPTDTPVPPTDTPIPSIPTLTPTPAEPVVTQVVIDGQPEDWANYFVVGTDPADDQVPGSPDLAEVRTFSNDQYFYLLISQHEDGDTDHYDILMDVNGGNYDYQLSVWPERNQAVFAAFPVTRSMSPLAGVTAAQDEVIEVKMPLSAVGGQPVRKLFVQTFLGDRVGDIIEDIHSVVVNETEPAVAAQAPTTVPESLRTERPGHVFLTDGTQAEYLYRSFIQNPFGLVWGPDGCLYITDSTGRHVVRRSPDGALDDLGIWRDPNMWQHDGPRGLAFDSSGTLYVNDHGHIYRIDDGRAEALPGVRGSPVGSIAFSPSDDLYYTDRGEGRVLKWNPDGTSEVIADGLPFAENLVLGLDGTLYVSQMGRGVVQVDVTTGEVSEFFSGPLGPDPIFLAVDADGDIWMRGLNALYQVAPDGTEKPYVIDGRSYSGEGPPGRNWHTSAGIVFDNEGGLWIASCNSRIWRLNPPSPGQETEGMSISVVKPGLEASDLDTGPRGEIYAYNENTQELWRISPEGDVEVLAQYGNPGRVGVAVDDDGTVHLGLPHGEISRLEADGSLSHYASLLTPRMVFGADGYLYAAMGDFGQPKSIVRITSVDTFITLVSEIGGVPLGPGEVHVVPAAGEGLYVFDESSRNLYLLDFDGQGRLVADLSSLGGGGMPCVIATSPTGDVFFIPHGPYKVYRIDSEGSREEYAVNVYGDPWGMVVSPDGQWLYVAESGAIDKIPIR